MYVGLYCSVKGQKVGLRFRVTLPSDAGRAHVSGHLINLPGQYSRHRGLWFPVTTAAPPTTLAARAHLADWTGAAGDPALDRAAALARFGQLPGTAWLRSDSYATRRAVWQALLDFIDEESGGRKSSTITATGSIAARSG